MGPWDPRAMIHMGPRALGMGHWWFYSWEILRYIPRTQVSSSWWVPFEFWWVYDSGRSDFGISECIAIIEGRWPVFNNYGPVSLLCVLSKVFETVMYNQLIDFLIKKNIGKEQFGFRKLHSLYMALMLMDKLIKSLENGEFVIGIFLDFSTAFDTVDHVILLEKLYHHGIRETTLDWFNSYLSLRKQYAMAIPSHTKTVSCRVPQGSILRPLLFLIYIND